MDVSFDQIDHTLKAISNVIYKIMLFQIIAILYKCHYVRDVKKKQK